MLQIGSRVRIKQNAYKGSDDQNDFLARGKVGVIVYDLDGGCWEVQTEDDEFELLTTEEIEEIEGEAL